MAKVLRLFFDIETSGLPPKSADWKTDYMEFPHILSVCWLMGNNLNTRYVKPPHGLVISPDAQAANKLIIPSLERVGIPFTDLLTYITIDAAKATRIIGHNVYFDISILKANAMRYGNKRQQEAVISAFDKEKRLDTMRLGHKYVLPKGRWPKLEALHQHLFGHGYKAHDVLEDVLATERVFNKMLDDKLIPADYGK